MIQLVRRYGKLSFLFFLVGSILGAVFAHPLQHVLLPFVRDIRKVGVSMRGESLIEVAFTIFSHNLTTSLTMLIGGIVFGIIPLVSVMINGALVGFVLTVLTQTTHVNPILLFFTGIFPHGIFEIPAYLLASGFGLELGFTLFRSLWHRKETRSEWVQLRTDFGPSILWIIIFLAIAACIEAGITPHLLAWAIGTHH
ncbi:MAG: stage II sporulation protein M [Acidibacillus sp.]|nr:stage II sporulation protein M [Acidibacillus sp.]